MPYGKKEKKSQCEKVRDLHAKHINFWGPRREAMTELLEFLGGDRFEDDGDAYSKDRRLIMIRGQETADTVRHKTAKLTERPRNIEAKPMDKVDDPFDGEVAAALIDADLSNPWKAFDAAWEAALIAAQESRLGVVVMDWEPDCGEYGEILDRWVDGRRVMWDETYEDPHHPLCNWFLEEKRVDAELANEIYGVDWIVPDSDGVKNQGVQRTGRPVMSHSGNGTLPMPEDDGKATLWFCWYKNDKSVKNEQKDYNELDSEERYMSCSCGYRGETQGMLRSMAKVEDELPEAFPEGCPECGGELKRIDATELDETTLAYRKGKRLVIVAPFSSGPDDQAVYDGSWPIPTARSFPVLVITEFPKPGEPTPPCTVDNLWDGQIASDHLRTMALQRVFEHRNYWELPGDGLYDYRGERFTFREDQFNVMYRDGTSQFAGPVKLHQGTGLDPNWPIAFNATQQALTQYRGVTDLGFTPESSKNIAASTVAQLTEQAETQTEHFGRRAAQALSKYIGVRWDYMRATYKPARLQRLNIEGVDQMLQLRGDDLPNYDFVLSVNAPFTGLEKARSEAFEALMQVYERAIASGLDPQALIEVFAEVNNLPKSIVSKFSRMFQEMQEKMAMQAEEEAALLTGGGVGVPPGGAPPSEFEEMAGLSADFPAPAA